MRGDDVKRPLWGLVGVGGDELLALGPDLGVGPGTFVVAGPPKSGRSTVLVSMVRSMVNGGGEVVLVAPRPSPLRDLAGSAGVRRLLDGSDLVTDELAALLPRSRVVGVDVDDAMLASEWKKRSAEFVAGTAYALPFEDSSFELVTAIEVFEHLEDPGSALAEMVRVASRYGLVSVPREPLWRVANVASGRYLRALGNTPLMANMVEGGKTPPLPAAELEAMGFALVIFPGGIVRAFARLASEYYASLAASGTSEPFRSRMLDFVALNDLIGTPEMLALGKRYDSPARASPGKRGTRVGSARPES